MAEISTDEEARRWLEERLGRDVPEATWRQLCDEGYVAAALDKTDAFELKDLLDVARFRLFSIPGRKGRLRKPREREVAQRNVTHAESQRTAAFTFYLSRIAKNRIEVRRMRNRLFGGRTLNPEEADQLTRSEAVRLLPHDFFLSHGIPVVGHRSWFCNKGNKKPASRMSAQMGIWIEWEGGHHRVESGLKYQTDALAQGNELRIGGRTLQVARGSVLDEIAGVAKVLARSYDWSGDDALRVTVTGGSPIPAPMTVEQIGDWRPDHTHFSLRFTIEPWVSPNTVLRIYREMQQRIIGQQSRPLGDRNLRLFDFVSARVDQAVAAPSWRQLMKEWNQKLRHKQEWQYQDVRVFSRDYWRTGEKLVFPSYGQIFTYPEAEQLDSP